MADPIDKADETFFREVDEEVRRDRLAGLWKRYGRWLLIGVGLVLIALAGLLFWREEQRKDAAALSETFDRALAQLDAGDTAAATPVVARVAASDKPTYRALGQLTQAAVASRDGDTAGAIKLYDAVANDDAVADPLRQLATLRSTRAQFDTLPVAALVERLKPLAQPGSPWFGVAGEMLAIAQLRDGKPAVAGPLFAAIAKDATQPPTLRARASQMAATLGADPLPAELGTAATPQPATAQPAPPAR